MSRDVIRSVAAAAVLLLAVPALAGPAEREQRRRQARDKIHTLRLMRLVQALELDDRAGIQVAQVLRKSDDDRRALHDRAREKMSELRTEVDKKAPRPAELNRLVEELLEIRRGLHRIEEQELQALRGILTPVQQARFVLVMHDFRSRVEGMIRRQGRRFRDRRGPGPGGPPPPPEYEP